ncbi:ABC transporter ATP-binding protein [Lachnoclostridium sp. An181]|uniref:ABC transporter ATP-binding protein n=1 Tax=Lachnoclostridium sp. An181 TaxID=1965575 RepID=UPI000B3A3C76|nr:ABC transporter ATP-binding protein [Lachnoclostridium sp. An181]OUP50427.1 multidrug ABC transporter ATP-binding protein [Lachnoclostridium sp. An181]
MALLEVMNLRYGYEKNKNILKGISAEFEARKFYAILGPSGCGKSTLLSLIGGLEQPNAGKILYKGKQISELGLQNHRKQNVAFVFQNFNLLEYMTAEENVALVSELPPLPILKKMGLTQEEAKRNVKKLSGGQQQRVAIARALASERQLLLADEPTGNLDEEMAQEIIEILKESAYVHGKCVIVVTHSLELAGQADVVLTLKGGKLL